MSQGEVADLLSIRLKKDLFYQDARLMGRQLGEAKETREELIFDTELPKLLASVEEKKRLNDQADSAQEVMGAQFLTSFVVQFFLSGALSLLWNIFNTLQILLALEMLNLVMPANVTVFYNLIKDTVNFQLVPKDTLYDNLVAKPFGLETAEEKHLEAEARLK